MKRTLAVVTAVLFGAISINCVSTGPQQQAGNGTSSQGSGGLGASIFKSLANMGHAIGNAIGGVLDQVERRMLASATQRAASGEANQRISWQSRSSETGKVTRGYVVPGEIYTQADGRKCRDILQVVEKDGKAIEATTTTCQQGKGWREVAL